MSRELDKLETMARTKCITDYEHIDSIISYMLSLPFSHLRKDEGRYRFLRNDLSKGFGLDQDELERMSFEDILILIGYEPGNAYFDPPDKRQRGFGRMFNTAGSCYVLALLLNELSKTDIHIKEFTCIEVSAYIDYLKKKVAEEYRSNSTTFHACQTILHTVDLFRQRTISYVNKYMDGRMNGTSTDTITIGNLISQVLKVCGRSWLCTIKELEVYSAEIIDNYDLINWIFMDSIRIPLVCSDRERFREIITRCRSESLEGPANIDYGPCYEHGIIHKYHF